VQAGDLVADRFEVLGFAAAGGMASVHRARDRQTGELVALKRAIDLDAEQRERFLREARILATLDHPNVVRYVSSGIDHGAPFLAMEWIEGETLSQRVRREGALGTEDVVTLMCAIGAGIAHAHRAGLVHRDVKPSNVMLPNGELARAKVLDFGLARLVSGRSALTQTGMLVGTLGYMAPELVREPDSADARSDVFALGCVLHQCLTGRAPYPEREIAVVIGRILFDPPPSVLAVAPGASPRLAALALACMDKDPANRPRDADAVVELVRAIDAPPPRSQRELARAITHRERRRGSVVLVASTKAIGTDERTTAQALCPPDVLSALLAPFAARSIQLGEDMAVVLVAARGAAVDQATDAVRCALALAETLPHARCTVVSGQAEAEGAPVLGDLFARSIALDRSTPPARAGAVVVDDLTGNLVGERFRQLVDGGTRYVLDERTEGEPSRRLLGRATPFVGRERELAELTGLLAEAEPRLATVWADAGAGKSRLRAELLARVRASHPELRIVRGAGDPRTASSPLALVRALLRSLLGLGPEDQDDERGQAEVRRRLLPLTENVTDVAPFVGELVGIGWDERDHPRLRAARRSRDDFLDQLRQTFVATFAAEAQRQPLLVVLEDVHWADAPSLSFVDALRREVHAALVVMAFGRPTFLADHLAQLRDPDVVVELGPLSARAAERLVRAVLPEIEPAALQAMVGQSLGNAFFLEELVRAHSQGGRTRPETVVTALQARVEALEPRARRFLRAASVVGEVFWLGAVAVIVGEDEASLAALARTLENAELVARQPTSRFPHTAELGFRHALVRDAAHAMLADADRRLAHRLLAEWLVQVGEHDPLLLANHWDLGGEPELAAQQFLRAAERALGAGQVVLAAELARRARGPDDRSGKAALIEAESTLANDARVGHARALRAAELLEVGSADWYRAQFLVVSGAMRIGWTEQARAVATAVLDAPLSPDAIDARISLVNVAHSMAVFQDRVMLGRLYERTALPPGVPPDPLLDAFREIARSMGEVAGANVATAIREFRRIARIYESLGQPRRALPACVNYGYNLAVVGAVDASEAIFRSTIARAEPLGMTYVVQAARANLGLLLLERGSPGAALPLLHEARQHFVAAADGRFAGSCLAYLARAYVAAGNVEEALRSARTAVAELEPFIATRGMALGALALAELAAGDAEAARRSADEAHAILSGRGGIHDDAFLRLAWIRAMVAVGDRAAAAQRARDVFENLRLRYESLSTVGESEGTPSEAELRASFRVASKHVAVLSILGELTGCTATWDGGIVGG
jgi:tetratricopeptide (TPR) repeat protein